MRSLINEVQDWRFVEVHDVHEHAVVEVHIYRAKGDSETCWRGLRPLEWVEATSEVFESIQR